VTTRARREGGPHPYSVEASMAKEDKKGPAQSVAPSFIQGLYDAAVKEHGLVDQEPVPYVVPTGSTRLDDALGVGGYPAGRITEIYGPEASGKTTLAMHACVNAQAMGKSFGVIDMETTLDLEYFRKLGVQGEHNRDWLHVCPEVGEDAFDIATDWVDAGVNLIVVDSVAVMTPRAEFDGDSGEAFMGLQARMMGQGLRKLVARVHRHETVFIFINQVRQKIGVVFGNPEVTTGGNALKFYASVRLDIRQVGDPINDKAGVQIGRASKVTVKKNKCAPPLKSVEVPIIWGRGIAPEYELFDVLLIEGILGKKSSYYTYGDQTFAGKQNALDFIAENAAELQLALDVKRKG
jgi:recombination protein RecA